MKIMKLSNQLENVKWTFDSTSSNRPDSELIVNCFRLLVSLSFGTSWDSCTNSPFLICFLVFSVTWPHRGTAGRVPGVRGTRSIRGVLSSLSELELELLDSLLRLSLSDCGSFLFGLLSTIWVSLSWVFDCVWISLPYNIIIRCY